MRRTILLLAALFVVAEAFVPSPFRGVNNHNHNNVKGVRRTRPTVALQAEPKKGKRIKKAVKKKRKTTAIYKKPGEQTTVTTAPPPPPQVAVGTRASGAGSVADIPLHEIGMPKTSPKSRPGIDGSSIGDESGGRPGAIIETEEQLERKQEIFDELQDGVTRKYSDKKLKLLNEYGEVEDDEEGAYDIDDPDAIDAATLGTWTIKDLQSKFPWEWDPEDGDPDPNTVELQKPGLRYKDGVDVDEDGVEIGYDPMFGPSNPNDERTILGAMESYMINDETKDEAMLTPEFPTGDLEVEYNSDVVQFRKSLDMIETFTDEFLNVEVPLHMAKWHGYPEPMSYAPKNETNNRFLDETATDWSKLDPYRSRRKAVELARAQNADWLPNGKSQAWHNSQREPYEQVGTLVGSLREADTIDETLVKAIQPALDVLGSCVDLLSIEQGTVFRFHYHGLIKNKHGMACWAETLIRDCGAEVTGVVFETGFRKRDQPYDGGDCWYPPST